MNNDINNYFKITGNDIIIKVKIAPGSSKNKIIGVYNDSLKITITARRSKAKPIKNALLI